ncbi:hypothetical protein DVH24_029590 [Malus domestica]|uniref:Fe2OG dioxygenase domain-containing protein n=1 Tax=Malus domestica TaxID=3750 RepID=A0A498HW29_MALDO|nr:hypothetical protein DVH24_029590 [Malus domestica]
MEIKKQNKDVIAGSGYMAPSNVNPLNEALGLYDLGSHQAVDSFSSQLDASSHQMINKYNLTPESVGSSGVQLHTDSGFLTILQDDENVGGLEEMDKSGAFVDIDPCLGTLLVNLRDVAQAWNNGRLCNVKHRVQGREATVRVWIATFLSGPKQEVVVLEAPPEFVDSEHPRLYVPFTCEDYRKLRLSTKLQAGEAGEAVAFVRTPS